MTAAAEATPYTFNNDEPTAGDLLDHLATMLDDFSRERLRQAGVRPGARCLEVGAGAGTLAHWMADEVGPAGEVIATDLKPQHIRSHERVTVLVHDVLTDPMPAGAFDVIHARLLLAHLPQRHEVLRRFAAALAPGGAVVLEEWEPSWRDAVLTAPDRAVAQALFSRYHDAFVTVLRDRGQDPTWARGAHQAMADAGLADLDTVVHSRSWRGGTPGCLLPVTTTREVQDRLIGAGMTADELDELRALLMDPRLVIQGNLTFSTIGRRPS